MVVFLLLCVFKIALKICVEQYIYHTDPTYSTHTRPQFSGRKDIVEYLFQEYGSRDGDGLVPKGLSNKGAGGGKGSKPNPNARPDNNKMKPLTLYGWEGAKYVTPVRETLCELSLAHVFVNCAPGSANR